MRRIKAKSISIGTSIVVGILVGCTNSVPSEGQLKRQISSLYTNCPLISISNFEKINGMMQRDGSYLAAIRYTLTLTPTDNNRRDFKEALRLHTQYEADKLEQAKEDEKENAECEKLGNTASNLQEDRNVIEADLAELNEYRASHATNDQGADALYKKYLRDENLSFKHSADRSDAVQLCKGKIYDSRARRDRDKEEAELLRAMREYYVKIKSDFSSHCHTELFARMPLRTDSAEEYGTERRGDFSETIRFVKTDNGWARTRNE